MTPIAPSDIPPRPLFSAHVNPDACEAQTTLISILNGYQHDERLDFSTVRASVYLQRTDDQGTFVKVALASEGHHPFFGMMLPVPAGQKADASALQHWCSVIEGQGVSTIVAHTWIEEPRRLYSYLVGTNQAPRDGFSPYLGMDLAMISAQGFLQAGRLTPFATMRA